MNGDDNGDQTAEITLWAVGAALFALYVFSAYPTLSPYRDAGDMAAGAVTLGIAHPPGYPVYLLLCRLWLGVFHLGNAAMRLHALSALAGAAAAAVAADAAVGLVRGRGSPGTRAAAAAGAALLLGLAPSFWHLSMVVEMYAVNALVAACLLRLSLPEGSPGTKRLCLAGLLAGLGLGNHQTLVAAFPGLLWIAWPAVFSSGFGDRSAWTRRLPLLAAFALLGLAVHAYLPVRSLAEPALDWGEPETPRNLFRVLTRADYGGVRLHPERPMGLGDPAAWLPGLAQSARLFAGELGWTGALLALWGLWAARRSRGAQGCFAAFFLAGPAFIVFANLDPAKAETYAILEPHLVLPLVFAAALAGAGLSDLLARASRASGSGRAGPALAGLLLAASWAWTQRPVFAARTAARGDFSAWDYGTGLLASMPRGALLLDPDDPTAFTLSYLALAEGRRRDVVPLLYFRTRWGYEQLKKRRPELLPEWEIGSGQELRGSLVSRAFAAGRDIRLDLPQKAPPGLTAFPDGLSYRLLPSDPPPAERAALYAESLARGRVLRFRKPPEGTGFFTSHTGAYLSSALNNLGIEAEKLGRPEEAVELYRRALAVKSGVPEAWNNMGNAALNLNDPAAAEGRYLAAIRSAPTGRAVYNLGRVYLMTGRYEDAEREYKRSAALGGPLEAENDLGLVYLRTGRPAEAVSVWTGLVRRVPGYALAYYNLGTAYERLGDTRRAAAAVSVYAALADDPAEREEAARWLRRLDN